MDVLVHHCLRELSFDGDLGCNVSRLKDFIVNYYNSSDGPQQVVDDTFCAFVWSVVVQQPAVRVGFVPPGVTSEVYVAPQIKTKRKAAATGEELVEDKPSLEVIGDARGKALEELKQQYGDDLRIAVDPQTCFVAITGSHIRPAKLSAMVYSALQLITRGREEGITTVELGRKTKYDQKTCFYVIKQLVELDLVVKVRRGGVGNYTCIHKYFVERSPLWQRIQREEGEGEVIVTGTNLQPPDTVDEVGRTGESPQIMFDTIDGRHLSSLHLIKNRVVRLLKASMNHIHASNNLLVAIGFNNPTKTDRRFFRTRLRELIQQGVIERVLVPPRKPTGRMVKCIRLVQPDSKLPEGILLDVDGDEKDVGFGLSETSTNVKTHLTIHKQVSNLLEEAGPSGLTLQEICISLGNFDKRTIELLLTRAARAPPPSHLRDLGTVDVMETYGRERRHRYFTNATYRAVLASENLQDASAPRSEVGSSYIGEFAEWDPGVFYGSNADFVSSVASDSKKAKVLEEDESETKRRRLNGGDELLTKENEVRSTQKRGRPRKIAAVDSSQSEAPRKRGRPRKHPLPEVGPRKRGRPPNQKRRGSPDKPVNVSMDLDGETVLERLLIRDGVVAVDSTMEDPDRRGDMEVVPEIVDGSRSLEVDDNEPLPKSPRIPVMRLDVTSKVPSLLAVSRDAVEGVQVPRLGSQQCVREPESVIGGDMQVLHSRLEGIADEREIETHSFFEAQTDEGSCAVGDDRIGTYEQPHTPVDTALVSVVEPSTVESSMDHILSLIPTTLQPYAPERGLAGSTGKRSAPCAPSGRPAKRPRTDPSSQARPGINLSALRRENELCRVIEELGGIANLHTKEFYESHTALLETMTRDGEPTSAPVGTRPDKRTVESTLRSLENRGRIKMLRTSLVVASGTSKPACLVHFPDTPQERINSYLREINQSTSLTSTPPSIKTLGEPVEFGAASRRGSQRPPSLAKPIRDKDEVSGDQSSASNLQGLISSSPSGRRRRRTHVKDSTSTETGAVPLRQVKGARHQRAAEWEQLLNKVHTEPVKGSLAARIRAIRTQFMQSTLSRDLEQWESKLKAVITENGPARKGTIERSKQSPANCSQSAGPPPLVANPPEKTIASLIAEQGPPIAQTTSSAGKGKDKQKEETENRTLRRPRFHWTREFDELARDASAIIRARCRDVGKLDLSAFDQVFPAVPRNSVRQRIAHLRENPAQDLYMKRLEDQWYTMWTQHRGSSHLPDDHPESPSNFDIVNHLEFLRKHVDKNALRVGFVEQESAVMLPTTAEELTEMFEVEENLINAPVWDFMWNSAVEEGREKQFMTRALTKELGTVTSEVKDDVLATAETALKMVFGTPNEIYDPERGARVLRGIGKEHVSLAMSNLLTQGVLSKLVRDPKKPKPGRTLKISDNNLNIVGGPFPREFFQDANTLEDIVGEGEVDDMEWSLEAHDGDVATLMQLVSEDQVFLQVDTSHPRSVRSRIDWNSKRADDDDVETSIRVKFSSSTLTDLEVVEDVQAETPLAEPEPTLVTVDDQADHGRTLHGDIAACGLRSSHGLVNCSRCLTISFSKFVAGLDQSDAELAVCILERVKDSKSLGVTKTMLPQFSVDPGQVLMLVQRMASLTPPVLIMTGYTAPVVVSSEHCAPWTVTLSEDPLTCVLPRRWLDVRGSRVDELWTAALRSVVGTVVLRPGIPQAELRWRLKAVYDRQEVVEAISFLEQDGTLEAKIGDSSEVLEQIREVPGWVGTLDVEEETRVCWFIGKKGHWYRV